MATKTERPNPIKLTDPDSGDTYTLDFSRETVKYAELRGFDITAVQNHPETGLADLFFYAFRKNHKNVARDKTDNLLQDLGGLLPAEVNRLTDLYTASISSLNLDGERKNSRLKVEL